MPSPPQHWPASPPPETRRVFKNPSPGRQVSPGVCLGADTGGNLGVGTGAEKMAPTGRQERKEDHVCLDRKCEALVLAFQLAGPPRASSFPRSPVPRHRRENTNAQSSWGSYALTSHSQHHCALPCPPQTPRPWASSRGQPQPRITNAPLPHPESHGRSPPALLLAPDPSLPKALPWF